MPSPVAGLPPHLSTAAALDVIGSALDTIDHAARHTLTHDQRLALIEMTRIAARRMEALLAAQVGEAERRNSAMLSRRMSLPSWLQQTATQRGETARLIRVARDLSASPALRTAALRGEVSLAQSRAIGRVLQELDHTLSDEQRGAAERVLVENARDPFDRAAGPQLAAVRELPWGERAEAEGALRLATHGRGQTAEALAMSARDVLAAVAPHVVADPVRDLEAQRSRAEARRAFRWWSWDGSTFFQGNLPVVEAASMLKQVAAHLEEDRRARRDGVGGSVPDQPDHPASPAQDADAEPGRRGHREPDPRTPEQKRADALAAMIDARRTQQASPGVGGDRPRVVALLDYHKLRDAAEQNGVLDTGEPISAGDLRRLCCEAEIVPVVLGGDSAVLDMGRSVRLATGEQRQALAIRDGGCVFPACDLPAWLCDAHHVLPWQHGGTTDLGGMVLLCPTHHALVEPRGPAGRPLPSQWSVQRDPLTGKPRCFPPLEWQPPMSADPPVVTTDWPASA